MLRISNHYISRYNVLLVAVEFIVLLGSYFAGINIRLIEWELLISSELLTFIPEAATFVFTMITSLAITGMYQIDAQPTLKVTISRLIPAMFLGFAALTLIFYLIPNIYLGRGALIIVMIITFFSILAIRVLVFKYFGRSDILQSRALVLGIGEIANEIISNTNDVDLGHRRPKIVGFIPYFDEDRCVPDFTVIKKTNSLLAMTEQHTASELIIAAQERRGGNFPIQELLECKIHGIKITDVATFFEREQGQIRMDSLYPSWLVFGGGFDQSVVRSSIKRVFDLLASCILLIATLPLMLITMLCILIEDGFPIFYRQERVGKGGDTFMVLKFRSMGDNAEQGSKPQWATADDPRTTRVGSIIRKLRIDELPQIVNVLKNEMSFVGPRPERPYFVDMLCAQVPYYNARHSIKPGITGWAQVRYPYGSSVEDAIEKLQYDLYYVKNHSLFLDIVILINTVHVVLGKAGR